MGTFLALALAATLTVKPDQYHLRAGCADSDPTLVSLAKGHPVQLRFALASGNRSCYAVTVEIDGQRIQGYVGGEALAGLEDFDRARRQASTASLPQAPTPARQIAESVRERSARSANGLAGEVFRAAEAFEAGRSAEAVEILSKAGAPKGHRDASLILAAALLELNQPGRALEYLEPALRQSRNDAQLLALAGTASYKIDDLRNALAYWKESLDLGREPLIEEAARRLERELAADQSGERSYGTRFLLRYDGAVADPALARTMVETLEEEFSRVASQLGCRTEERIVTIIQSREAYRLATGAAEWSGGVYDGRIRVPMAKARGIDPETRRTFTHELVHACLAHLGRWPTWLHEGMAQKMAGEPLHSGPLGRLKELARAGKLPSLASLGDGWLHLDGQQVALRYAQSLLAVDLFFQKYPDTAARNLMRNPENLPQVTASLDQALAATLR